MNKHDLLNWSLACFGLGASVTMIASMFIFSLLKPVHISMWLSPLPMLVVSLIALFILRKEVGL